MLTRKDFYNYLISTGCEVNPFDGINRTARQVEIINRKTENSFFISTPITDDYIVAKHVVILACTKLGVPLPYGY